MSSLNDIGQVTANVHARVQAIRDHHATVQNTLMAEMVDFLKKMQDDAQALFTKQQMIAVAFQSDLEELMNGSSLNGSSSPLNEVK
jgi:hypothetical protein